MTKSDDITVAGVTLSGKRKTGFVIVVTFSSLVLFGILNALLFGGFAASVACSVHAIAHKPMTESAIANGEQETSDPIAELEKFVKNSEVAAFLTNGV